MGSDEQSGPRWPTRLPTPAQRGESAVQHTPTRDLVSTRDYDFVDFEERDQRDEAQSEQFRATVFGLPARPGTRR